MMRFFGAISAFDEIGVDPMEFEIDSEEILETLGEQEKLLDGDFFNSKSF